MTKRLRQTGALLLVSTMTTGLAARHLLSARADALQAARDRAACNKLAASIRAARASGAASEKTLDDTDLVRFIEAAARDAGIPRAGLQRIWPGQPRPLDGGKLAECSVDVTADRLSLRQSITLLCALTDAHRGALQATSLRLAAANEDDRRGTWTLWVNFRYLRAIGPGSPNDGPQPAEVARRHD